MTTKNTIKVTFILKDLSKSFYDGFHPSIIGFNNLLSNGDRFDYLLSPICKQLKITSRVGNGSMRDQVELNQIIRAQRQSGGTKPASYKLESRKGYKLATFEFSLA